MDPKPPPYRLILGIGVALLVVGIPVALVVSGAIGEEKQRVAERDSAVERARQAADRKRLVRDQRPVRGQVEISSGPAAEEQLIAAIERAVATEAKRRVAAGELETKIAQAQAPCRVLPERVPRHLSMECVAVTSNVTGGEGENLGHLGYPFLVLASLEDGEYAFCKTNPNPGEGASRFGTTPLLSPDCSGREPVS